jgi:hypothetical protein
MTSLAVRNRWAQGTLAGVLALGAGLLGAPAGATPAAAHGRGQAEVTIVHGVRGLVATVSVDGKTVLTSFSPRRSAGPLSLSPGRHRIVVTTSAAHTPVLSTVLTLRAGEHVTAALGLNSAGAPRLYAYPDALRHAAAMPASLVMRDIADASRLHAMVDGKDDGSLATGSQLVHAVSVGKHTVSLVDPSTGKVVVASQRVPVASGAVTALYLIGSAPKQDLGWVATRVVPADAAPKAVHTGNSGLAAPAPAPRGWIVLLLLGILGLGFAAVGGRPFRHVTARASR